MSRPGGRALPAILLALAACASGQRESGAGALARGAPHVLFVGLESEDAVAVVDPSAGTVLRKIPVGISPEDVEGVHALTVSPDGRFAYLSIAHGFPQGSVWKMTTEKDSLVARADVGLFPATLALTSDGTWLFVANYNLHGEPQTDTVSILHAPTMTQVKQVPVCTKPHGLVASHDGRFVYVSCTRDNVIKRISVASLAVVDSTTATIDEDRATDRSCYPAGLALSPDGRKLYIACHRHGEIRVMETERLGRVTNRIPVGDGPYLIQVDPEGRRLWVPNRDDGTYSVIDLQTERVITTRPASAARPHTFAFAPGIAYLSMESEGAVPGAIDVIEQGSFRRLRSIPVGLQATGVGVVPLTPEQFRPGPAGS